MRRCGGRFEQGRDGIDGDGTADERTQGVGVQFGETLAETLIDHAETRLQNADHGGGLSLCKALVDAFFNPLLNPLLNPLFDPAFDPFLSNGHV